MTLIWRPVILNRLEVSPCDQRADAREQDLNFQTALARAIAAGREHHPDPDPPRPPHFVRPVYPPAERHSGCGSPAAFCADLGNPRYET